MTTRRRHYTPEDQQYSSQYNQSGYQQYNQGNNNGWTVTTHSETAAFSQGSTPAVPVLAEMTCRDRTQEFFSTIKSMQSRQVSELCFL